MKKRVGLKHRGSQGGGGKRLGRMGLNLTELMVWPGGGGGQVKKTEMEMAIN